MSLDTHKYTNNEVTIVWKPNLCQHAAKCWKGSPDIFKPREKPWITPESATTERIVAQVNQCPSGALSFFMNNEGEPQP